MKTVLDFAALDLETARQKYQLGKDVDDWKVEWAQDDVKDHGADERYATKILYRPGDVRRTYLTGRSRGFICRPRQDVMRHMMRENVEIITTRLTKDDWSVKVTDTLAAHKSGSRYDISYLFPLYLYPPPEGSRRPKSALSDNTEAFAGKSRIENIAPAFRKWLDKKYEHHYTPEEIFGYIYAVLHAPTYRSIMPSSCASTSGVPFPTGGCFRNLFGPRLGPGAGAPVARAAAARIGRLSRQGRPHGRGRTLFAEQKAIAINKTQVFKPVPQAVWEFHIGGYQVLDKYLKSRKGRVLSLDEINHVSAIADSLAFTIEQMARIGEAYRAAFADRG